MPQDICADLVLVLALRISIETLFPAHRTDETICHLLVIVDVSRNKRFRLKLLQAPRALQKYLLTLASYAPSRRPFKLFGA